MRQSAVLPKGKRRVASLRTLVMWGIVGLILLVSLFPFWWVVRTALIDPQEVYTNTTALFPDNPTLFNFARALGMVDLQESLARGGSGQTLNFWLYLRNSVLVATVITVGQVSSY
jgi:multiple sugar transport system permease protein